LQEPAGVLVNFRISHMPNLVAEARTVPHSITIAERADEWSFAAANMGMK